MNTKQTHFQTDITTVLGICRHTCMNQSMQSCLHTHTCRSVLLQLSLTVVWKLITGGCIIPLTWNQRIWLNIAVFQVKDLHSESSFLQHLNVFFGEDGTDLYYYMGFIFVSLWQHKRRSKFCALGAHDQPLWSFGQQKCKFTWGKASHNGKIGGIDN